MDIELIQDREYIIGEYKKPYDFTKSPLRYPGGKFYALKHIMPFIDCVPHDEFREPFVGGGSIFFGKRKSPINWINDLEQEIVDVYRAFADPRSAESVINLISNEVATPERHLEIKSFKPSNFIERAFKTYYLNRTSYSGIINKPAWGYKDGKSSPPENWSAFIKDASTKLVNTKITSLDFSEVIKAEPTGKNVLLYLDPPYFNADQKRAYTKPFVLSDHERLSMCLRETEYNFCLSYDDCSEIKELYSWANIYERKWLYNTANKKGVTRDLGNELVITNYKVKSNDLFTQIVS